MASRIPFPFSHPPLRGPYLRRRSIATMTEAVTCTLIFILKMAVTYAFHIARHVNSGALSRS